MQKLLEEKLEETVHLQGSDGEFQEEEHCREHEFVDLDDGSGAACLQCGAVMAETGQGLVLADADEFDAERGGRIGTTFHHSDLGIRRRTARSGPGRSMTLNAKHLLRKKRLARIFGYCAMLKIHSSRVKSRIIDLSMEAFDYGHNNSFDLTVISCCYIALREENIPISLKEVAIITNLKQKYTILGRKFLKLKNLLNIQPTISEPELHIPRICNSVIASAAEEERRNIIAMCSALSIASKKYWICQGRRSEGIAAALFCIAYGSLVNRSKRPPVPFFQKVAACVSCSITSLMERHTEILGILVDIGKTRIPWIGERLSNRNIYLHVADIVDSCADNNNKNDTTSAEMATPPPPLPPAFIRSKLRREILLERISKAKERVRLMLSFQFEGLEDNDAPLDELDEAIDQLLFQGFTADAIIEKKWPMSLVK